jgi:hypothetical protein
MSSTTDLQNLTAQTKDLSGFRIGQFYVKMTSTGILITDSRENAHIIVCYNKYRDAIDIHKKKHGSDACVFRKYIPANDVWNFVGGLLPKFAKLAFKLWWALKRVKVKDLEKLHFRIRIHGDEGMFDKLMQGSRIKRGNIILDPHTIRSNYREHYSSTYAPSAINDPGFPDMAFIHASRVDSFGSMQNMFLIKYGKKLYALTDHFYRVLNDFKIEISERALQDFEEIIKGLELGTIDGTVNEFVDQLLIDNSPVPE